MRKVKTKISDFLVAKIWGEDAVSNGVVVNLCHCENCHFSFYDKRLTSNEDAKLYNGYREKNYQMLREKYEPWYTEKINGLMNYDKKALQEQQRVIRKIMKKFITKPIKLGLDFGGNRGNTFCKDFEIEKQYVYDISGVKTVPGVSGISSFEELKSYSFDFIMCNMTLEHVADPLNFAKTLYGIGQVGTYYYLEVPSENPFYSNKFSISKNIRLLANSNYNKLNLVKYYLKMRKQPFCPMHEHVNFFTAKSMRTLLEKSGFKVLDIQKNIEKTVLGQFPVLSALCQK